MQLERLKIENFQSLGKINFDFPKGLVLIDGWNEDLSTHNGVGKSALLNSITYAIYGKLPKSVNVGELVREGTSHMSTEIDLESCGKHIKIIRTRGKTGKLILLVDFEEVKGTVKDLDEQIPDLVGLTFDQFVQVIYVFQNADKRFITLNDTDKKKFLSTILNLDVYDNAYKIAHSRLSTLELDNSKHTGKLEALESGLNSLINNIKETKDAEATFEEEKKGKVAEITNGVKTTKAEITDLEVQKAQAQNSPVLAQLQVKKSGIIDLVNKNSENKKDIATINMQIKSLQRDLDKYTKQLEKPETARCGECGQSLPGWSLEDHRKKIQENVDLVVTNIKEYEETRDVIKVINDTKLDEMLQKIMEDIASEKAKGPERFDPLIATKKAELRTYASQVQMLDQRADSLKRDIEKASRALEVARADIEQVKGLLKDSEAKKEYLLELKKIFSPTGIRAFVFDGIVKELNDRIHRYLETLSSGAIRFGFETDNDKGKFTEICEYMGTPRSIAALSGGEFRRLSLAVDLALSDVVCNRISVYPNVLFLDEAFEGLDATGRESVLDLLTDLVEQKDAIYVVDHATEVKTAFGKVFELIKRNGETLPNGSTSSEQTDSQPAAQTG